VECVAEEAIIVFRSITGEQRALKCASAHGDVMATADQRRVSGSMESGVFRGVWIGKYVLFCSPLDVMEVVFSFLNKKKKETGRARRVLQDKKLAG
jgi:hypothetical protein